MDYDYRNRPRPPYETQNPAIRPTNSGLHPSAHPMYGHPSLYPKVGQPAGSYPINAPPAVPPRNTSFNQPHPPASSPGIGIRVVLKPEYRITPPPPLSPQIRDIPRSNFHFDFEFERKVLAEAEKEAPNWSRLGLENLPSKPPDTTPLGATPDPVVNKYIASGLGREAVSVAVANYGDNPTKVKEFCDGYSALLEMGFSPNTVVEALLMYENDTSKALAFCLNGSA
ncbi:OLC1v1027572C1 [Oldenlandia corymbosa var. corymbosa]|uniref:OLC1v1027572C1 n=1 Tax=Oldenlandia corymbosa var. corymbosa TaxID=529605 RepID=A0AAV1CA17_OLDCO|nr:OLC1v1027572C1 [Oldenlandia corymbosa var. corymbosa]